MPFRRGRGAGELLVYGTGPHRRGTVDGCFCGGTLQGLKHAAHQLRARSGDRTVFWRVSGRDAPDRLGAGHAVCALYHIGGSLDRLCATGLHRRQDDLGRVSRGTGIRNMCVRKHPEPQGTADAGGCYQHRRTGGGHHLCIFEGKHRSRGGLLSALSPLCCPSWAWR